MTLLSKMVENLTETQPKTIALCRRLYMILVHLQLHNSNLYSTDLASQTLSYLSLAIEALSSEAVNKNSSVGTVKRVSESLISLDTVVVLLYNCLKTMLGFNHLLPSIVEKLDILLNIFKIEKGKKSYSIYILEMFFVIKIVIFKRKQETEENETVL